MSEIMKTKEYFLKAVAAVLRGDVFELPQDADFEGLFKLAKRNCVSGLLYCLLKDKNIEFQDKLLKEYKMSAIRNSEQEAEIELIRKDFSASNIDFMLLKGTHLKSLYPSPDLRFMVDMDVLVREADVEKAYEIIESHGLQKKMESDKDFVFIKPPFLTVEVHKSLFHPSNPFYPHFLSAFENAVKTNENEYKMTNSDLYVYTLAHLCEHYLEAGSCFRPCMDLYLLETKCDIDFDYADKEFKALGIDEFAKKIRKLIKCMFDGEEPDETAKMMENYIVLGAPVKNAAEAAKSATANTSKTKRIINVLFPKLSHMKHRYHILNRLPFLLPLFWIVRIASLIFSKNKRIAKRRNEVMAVDKSSIDIMSEIFEKSGLKKAE
ncbi:MAG: nucleotidyltransferase family protein [Oscillospiraceae bacterium]|nr:nucleotidyltransferase family protein [Oscillospiraceae bacterium]